MDEQSKDGKESQSNGEECRTSTQPPLTDTSSNNSPCQEGTQHTAVAQKVLLDVPHIQQHSEWDCGLACTQMVLRYTLPTPPSADSFRALCEKMDFGCSVWTVDLARIMAHFNIPHLLCTQTLGVDNGYQQETYYLNNFDKDKQRVNYLFTNTASLGMCTEKKSVTIQDIKDHLVKQNIAIVLVDSSKLHCLWCMEDRSCCCWPCYMLWCCVSDDFDDEKTVVASKLNETDSVDYKISSDSEKQKGDKDACVEGKLCTENMNDTVQSSTSTDNYADRNINSSENTQTVKEKPHIKQGIIEMDRKTEKVERAKSEKSEYQGHFIVVCGFSSEGMLYRNPGLGAELCCCTVQSFEDARKSYGTDEDILFVYQH